MLTVLKQRSDVAGLSEAELVELARRGGVPLKRDGEVQ